MPGVYLQTFSKQVTSWSA